MTTGVGRGKIKMTPLNSAGPKIGVGANSAQLSFTGAEFLSQNSLPWQRGLAGEKFR